MTRRILVAAVAAVAAFVPALAGVALSDGPYVDSVDLDLGGRATVNGTIRGTWERESFRLPLLLGSTVKAVVRRTGKSTLVPMLDGVFEGGGPVPDATVGTLRSGATLSFWAHSPGVHVLRAFGDGAADGDYRLAVKVLPAVRWGGDGTAEPGGAGEFAFDAPAGARATIRVRPGAGSPFRAAIDSLRDAEDNPVPIPAGGGTVTIPSSGTWRVAFHDVSGEGGAWRTDVKLRPARSRPSRVDIRAGALTGEFDDDAPVYGRLAGDGEALEVVADLGSEIGGASVTLPPGALPIPVVITMSAANPFDLPDGESPAGTPVDFGPEGTTFTPGLAATISIPYDPNVPTDQIRVYVLDEGTGVVSLVDPPYDFDLVAGTVSFPAPHFSTYLAATSGPRTPVGDWAVATLEAELTPQFGGVVGATAGVAAFDAEGGFTLTAFGVRSSWVTQYDDGGGGPLRPHAVNEARVDSAGGAWSMPAGDRVEVSTQDGTVTLGVGPRGDVAVLAPRTGENGVELSFLARLVRGSATPANLAGTWNVLLVSAGGVEDPVEGGDPRVRLTAETARGTMTFGLDGIARFRGIESTESETEFPSGTWVTKRSTMSLDAEYETSGAAVQIRLPHEQPPILGKADRATEIQLPPDLLLFAALDGDLLVGAQRRLFPEDRPTLLLLVRQGGRLRAQDLFGATTFTDVELQPVDRPNGTQGIELDTGRTHALVTAAGATAAHEAGWHVTHDPQGEPSAGPTDAEPSEEFRYTLARTGVFGTNVGVGGFMTARASLLLVSAVRPDDGRVELSAGIPGADFQVR